MLEITIDYQGALRCQATHGPSGDTLQTDAPVDNQGKGEAFSPTDLVATALGSCLLTVLGIAAGRKGIDLAGAKVRVEKEMTSEAPRRIGRLPVRIEIPVVEDHPEREFLEAALKGCPVHRSLHPDIEAPIDIHWGGA